VAVLRGVGAEIAPGETLVYCWLAGRRGGSMPGAVSVYASAGRPILTAGQVERAGERATGPFRGICPRPRREEAGYVIFTAEAR
jgi:hypothetical protein